MMMMAMMMVMMAMMTLIMMLDDCHATGFIGENGRGTAEYFGLEGKIDILSSTLGKALGGASGGFICAKENVIKLLKQKSRPYLFSNALSPSIVSASIKALDIIKDESMPPDKKPPNGTSLTICSLTMSSINEWAKGSFSHNFIISIGAGDTLEKMEKLQSLTIANNGHAADPYESLKILLNLPFSFSEPVPG